MSTKSSPGIARISHGLHVVTLQKGILFIMKPNTISEAADFKEGAA